MVGNKCRSQVAAGAADLDVTFFTFLPSFYFFRTVLIKNAECRDEFFLLFFALFFLLKHFITFWTKWCGPTLFYLINVAKYVLVFGQNDGKFCRPVHTSWNSNLFVIYIFIYIYVHVINKFFLKKCRFKKTRFSALISARKFVFTNLRYSVDNQNIENLKKNHNVTIFSKNQLEINDSKFDKIRI